jgi:ribosomal protein S18 acetylase RimI-like enzyme
VIADGQKAKMRVGCTMSDGKTLEIPARMSVEYVHIVAANARLLDRVAVDVFDHAIDPALVAIYLARPDHILVVAMAGGEIVGHARGVVHHQPDFGPQLYIDNLGVTPALKRKGIATGLMAKLVELGKARGCTDLWLATETDNEEAIGFYKSMKLLKTDVVMFANFVDD